MRDKNEKALPLTHQHLRVLWRIHDGDGAKRVDLRRLGIPAAELDSITAVLFVAGLVEESRVVCVVNRKGRAPLCYTLTDRGAKFIADHFDDEGRYYVPVRRAG